jgi:CheY-like chemotaxis protein
MLAGAALRICLPGNMRITAFLSRLFGGLPEPSCRGSSCDNTRIRQNSQPAVDLIPAGPGELFTLARILVVDDDAAVQVTVRLLLERAGHSVVTADDGRKGLALCRTGDFDLLFLDIFMPGMDGFETMRMVRQHRPLLPIIVISGQSASSEADKGPDFLTMATKLGAVSSLHKPFRPADLLAAVTTCLDAAGHGAQRPPGGVASAP